MLMVNMLSILYLIGNNYSFLSNSVTFVLVALIDWPITITKKIEININDGIENVIVPMLAL